jgi:ferredoxin
MHSFVTMKGLSVSPLLDTSCDQGRPRDHISNRKLVECGSCTFDLAAFGIHIDHRRPQKSIISSNKPSSPDLAMDSFPHTKSSCMGACLEDASESDGIGGDPIISLHAFEAAKRIAAMAMLCISGDQGIPCDDISGREILERLLSFGQSTTLSVHVHNGTADEVGAALKEEALLPDVAMHGYASAKVLLAGAGLEQGQCRGDALLRGDGSSATAVPRLPKRTMDRHHLLRMLPKP